MKEPVQLRNTDCFLIAGYQNQMTYQSLNEMLSNQKMAGLRAIPYVFFTLHDKHNEFLIKSSTLSCTIDNQTIAIDHNFLNFNEFLKSNLSYFNTLS